MELIKLTRQEFHSRKFLVVAMIHFSIVISVFSSHSTFAARYWPSQTLTEWTLSLNNGVAYITSNQIPDHCEHSRAQIDMGGTDFDRALYAYALSAKARDKSLRYVIDSDHTDCVISALDERD